MVDVINPFDFSNRSIWRTWLAENHANETDAWLVIQKKGSEYPGVRLSEAVEEALCFGWIDGRMQSRDDPSYLLRFSPRKPDSVWAISNIERVNELIAQGRMTEAGMATVLAAKESGQWQAAIDREDTENIPADLEAALRRKKGAIAAYRNLPASEKKRYVYWVQSAKRAETKQKRIDDIVRMVLEG